MYDILFSKKFIASSLLIASLYVITVTYLMNLNLIINTLIGQYPFDYKLKLLVTLLKGLWTAMSGTRLLLLFLIALLTGANLTLLWQKIRSFGNLKKAHVVVGGSSLIGIAGSGCAACGLPIISILGMSGSIVYLPFHGQELSYIAFLLLSISLISLIRAIKKEQACSVTKNVPV